MKAFILYIKEPNSLKYAKECVDSCKQFNIEYELVEGYFGKSEEYFRQNPPYIFTHHYEYPFSVVGRNTNLLNGHLMLYKKVIEYGSPAVILEHDAIVLRDFTTVDIPDDNSIYYLSVKVYNRDDYIPPADEFNKFKILNTEIKYDGFNAKIVTPTYCKLALDWYTNNTQLQDPYDFENSQLVNRFILDPLPVINDCGNGRVSTITPGSQSAVLNEFQPTWRPISFYKNLKTTELFPFYKECKYPEMKRNMTLKDFDQK